MNRSLVGMSLCVALAACGPEMEMSGETPVQADTAELSTNLVYNGDFEQGPSCFCGATSADYTVLSAGDTRLTGWSIEAYGVDHIGTHWTAASGAGSVDLNAYNHGAVTQVLSTQAGRKYRLTFSMAGNPVCNATETLKTLEVRLSNGDRASFSFSTAGKTMTNMGWVTRTVDFTAASSSTSLSFASMTFGTQCGPALDKVSVVAL